MNDFASFRIHFRRDAISIQPSYITLLLIFQNATMEFVGVPIAYYDGITHQASRVSGALRRPTEPDCLRETLRSCICPAAQQLEQRLELSGQN